MKEKRTHPRSMCEIQASLDYFPGDPDSIDIDITMPVSMKGFILDISAGGAFFITNEKVSVNSPVRIFFSISNDTICAMGRIVRTGTLQDNPSEPARKFSNFSVKCDNYIAIRFDEALANFNENDIKP